MLGGFYSPINLLANSAEQVNLDAQGMVAQTFDRVAVDGFTALSDQRLYLTLIPLRAGQVLTNAVIIITVAGGTLTLGKIGIYDSAFNLVAETANQTTEWETTGTISTALTTPYTVPSTGGYYAAIVSSGTTRPTVAHGKASATTAEAVGSGLKPHGIQGSQTDLPDDASISGGQMPIWIGFT